MTSLYDKYHSEKNIMHMYNLLKDIVYNNIDRKLNDDDYNTYRNILSETFIKTDQSNIININKELLNNCLQIFMNTETEEPKISTISKSFSNFKSSNISLNNKNPIENRSSELPPSIDNRSSELPPSIDNRSSGLPPSIDNRSSGLPPSIDINAPPPSIHIHETDYKKTIILSSNNRNRESSRFNYTLNQDIDTITNFDKLIIPIECTSHFVSPVLRISIPELSIDTILTLKDTNKLNNYIYGTYIPDDKLINNNETINRFNISINGLHDVVQYESDIYGCILNKNIITGDFDKGDFKINDIVQLDSNGEYYYSKIINITDTSIEIEDEYEFSEIYLLNMNLQNMLFFN